MSAHTNVLIFTLGICELCKCQARESLLHRHMHILLYTPTHILMQELLFGILGRHVIVSL